jgi:Holliday junction resolvase
VNRPKRKGTAAETAVVRYAWGHGFPYAHRITLGGATDFGDVSLAVFTPSGSPPIRLVVEVKATSRRVQVKPWLDELARECAAWQSVMGATGFLVVKYPGVGDRSVDRWLAVIPDWSDLYLTHMTVFPETPWFRGGVNGPNGFVNQVLRQKFVKLGPNPARRMMIHGTSDVALVTSFDNALWLSMHRWPIQPATE